MIRPTEDLAIWVPGCLPLFLQRQRTPVNFCLVSKKPTRPAKPAREYPAVTHGSQVAARGRRKANKMTDAQREEYFRRGMVVIYGGQTAETVVAGHERSV
jgi:hypothetical protein